MDFKKQGTSVFDMLVVTSLSILSFTDIESMKIKNVKLFFNYSVWSIFSFLWIFLVLFVISPYKIELWEATFTLILYAVFLIVSNLVQNLSTSEDKQVNLKNSPVHSLLSEPFYLNFES